MRTIFKTGVLKAMALSLAAAAAIVLPTAAEPYKIGVSNAYVDTWRSQLLEVLNELNEKYVAEGITSELVIQSGATNAQGQIAQIRSLVNQGVDALLVIPSSETALNLVLQEAVDSGVKVFSITQAVTEPDVIGVMVNQTKWALGHGEWLVDQLNGEGDVVLMNGLAGAPANEARVRAISGLLAENPGINVLNSANGDWDVVKAQQVTSSILAAQPDIDGIWVSGAMSEGVLRALVAANPTNWPILTGDTNLGYLRQWKKVLETNPDFVSVGVYDPPGVEATAALKIAIRLLQGKEFKDGVLEGDLANTYYIADPAPMGADELDAVLAEYEGRPDTYFLDYELPDEEIDALFK